MNIVQLIKNELLKTLTKLGYQISDDHIIVSETKDLINGDYATNIAMQLAKVNKANPAHLAHDIINNLSNDLFDKVTIAGPGFINFYVKMSHLTAVLSTILAQKENYGRSNYGKNETINIEFVSANPTGSMHLGHARGAAIGDTLARLYQAIGYQVTKEFYVNDAGAQIDNLAKSIYARYMQLFALPSQIPTDGYHGQDIIEIAKQIKQEHADGFVNKLDLDYFKNKGIAWQLQQIKQDLGDFKVAFDVYTSELSLRGSDNIEQLLKKLAPYIYQFEGATFLKTSDFGDDKDRVIIRSDGQYTYFLPDIIYHLDKLNRNHQKLIDILGADHHGYISRMKAALMMLGYAQDTLTVEIIQMVRLIKDGQEVKMSKRTGVGVTLKELVEEIGVDVARYFFINRAASSHLDFDLNLALTASNANPVYYAQYAHARLNSLLNAGAAYRLDELGQHLHTHEERQLLRHLISYPSELIDAAISKSPYKMANYIQKLATYTHSFYTICRVIDDSKIELSQSRLALVKASQITLANSLSLIGITALEKM